MKKFILAVALLLSAAGASTSVQRFSDPLPECPPACNTGNDLFAVQ